MTMMYGQSMRHLVFDINLFPPEFILTQHDSKDTKTQLSNNLCSIRLWSKMYLKFEYSKVINLNFYRFLDLEQSEKSRNRYQKIESWVDWQRMQDSDFFYRKF